MGAQLSICSKCATELNRMFLDRIIKDSIEAARQHREARRKAHRRFMSVLEKSFNGEKTHSDNRCVSIRAPKICSTAHQMAMISRKRKFPFKPAKNFYCKYPRIYTF